MFCVDDFNQAQINWMETAARMLLQRDSQHRHYIKWYDWCKCHFAQLTVCIDMLLWRQVYFCQGARVRWILPELLTWNSDLKTVPLHFTVSKVSEFWVRCIAAWWKNIFGCIIGNAGLSVCGLWPMLRTIKSAYLGLRCFSLDHSLFNLSLVSLPTLYAMLNRWSSSLHAASLSGKFLFSLITMKLDYIVTEQVSWK